MGNLFGTYSTTKSSAGPRHNDDLSIKPAHFVKEIVVCLIFRLVWGSFVIQLLGCNMLIPTLRN